MKIAAAVAALVLLVAGQVSAQQPTIILYDFEDFDGRSLTLNESAPDLDDYNWDNDVESLRILSGTWEIYRDDDYGSRNGPSFVLSPGDYPDIAQNPGFPGDRMSSVRLVEVGQQPLPPPAQCPAPYRVQTSDGRCVWSCSQGTQPDPASDECVCQPGFTETGQDQFGRRVCTAAQECPGPYRAVAPDGRCVWSCSQGTQPDPATNECVCQSGLTETGQDQFGRRVCTAARDCPGPYRVETADGRCVWSCGQGTRPDPASNQCVCQRGLREVGQDRFGRRVCR